VGASQNVDNLATYLDGEHLVYGTQDANNSSWIAFEVDHFSTRYVSFTQVQPLFTASISGSSGSVPTDTDGDGLYEDVDGDGQSTFTDAIALAFADTSSLSAEQRAALDFDDDGDVDFSDAISLAFAA
ncbi:MAG: hypothetical protein ACQETI_09315, partial [Halobacteriota archaeon]